MEKHCFDEVYKNDHGAVYQCGRKNCFFLEFGKEMSCFKVADFIQFKKSVDALDVASLLKDSSRTADITVLMPFRCNRCFVLSPLQVFYLKELLAGAQFMLELNSLLHDCLMCPTRSVSFI